MASYGLFDLGAAVTVAVVHNPSEKQINTFFGYSGVQSVWGGQRGRVIEVTGVFAASTAAGCYAIRDQLRALDDGVARVLTDNTGTTYSNVVYTGAFQPLGKFAVWNGLVVLPYRAVFESRV